MQSQKNIEREDLILKIYLSLSDVRNFMKCSWKKAHEIVDKCKEMAKSENKINPEGKVYYKYLLKITGIKESDIHRLAQVEREIKAEKEKDAL